MARAQDRIATLSAKHIRMPLKETFETAKRRTDASDVVIVELTTETGIVGIGSATPVEYVTGETVDSVMASVREVETYITGMRVLLFPGIALKLSELLPDAPSARAAIEFALIDAVGKLLYRPFYQVLGGKARRIETDLTIPVVPPEHASELAASAAEKGFSTFKVKVGSKNIDEDLDRAIAISRIAPQSRLIVDANQGFEPEQAVSFARRLAEYEVNVAVYEQPVDRQDVEGLAYVTRSVHVPVFADESVLTRSDLIKLARSKAVSGVNIKLMKSGFFGAAEIAIGCRAYGLDMMLGCMIEARPGITAAVHFACVEQGISHFDLDADLLLAEQGCGGFIRNGAWIEPVKAPGLGCQSES